MKLPAGFKEDEGTVDLEGGEISRSREGMKPEHDVGLSLTISEAHFYTYLQCA